LTQAHLDYIVLGQGLAGTLIASELIDRGKTVLVIDSANPNSASRVAAGLFNPLTFKRLNFAWNAVDALPLMKTAYGRIEENIGKTCYFNIPIRRYFPDDESHEAFLIKQDLPLYEPILGETDDRNEHGSGIVHRGGYVDLKVMLPGFRSWLESKGWFAEETIEDHEIEATPRGVRAGQYTANHLIFCRGVRDVQSPFWNHIPLKPAKGEVLVIKAPELSQDTVHNNGKFVLPIGDSQFRTGSTYTWDQLDEIPTESGKEEILSKFAELHPAPVEVVEHVAGIRPTVKDRRPLVGTHSHEKHFSILNGLGTRGVMIGPWCAVQLADYLLEGGELNREIDVDRAE